MAKSRSIPTGFFKDPDIVNLCKESQLLLIGLALGGDDEGRGVASAKVLEREMDYSPEQIETALRDLVENDLIVLYQVGRHRYYQITQDWQSALGGRRTASKFPVPPDVCISSGSADISSENTCQPNLTEPNRTEEEGEPSNVTPFPTTRSDSDGVSLDEEKTIETTTQEVAAILQLNVSASLRRVVVDFLHDPALSLTGEADMAREYIDNPQRNRHHKAMSPAFYRQWLKRERAHTRATAATGTTGSRDSPGSRDLAKTNAPTLAGRSLMNLEAEYHQQRKEDPSP
jgi:DNA-binding PadR family transcriptional regulator